MVAVLYPSRLLTLFSSPQPSIREASISRNIKIRLQIFVKRVGQERHAWRLADDCQGAWNFRYR
jgi:hypothetical protein